MKRWTLLNTLAVNALVCALAAGCAQGDDTANVADDAAQATSTVVDSVLPMEVMLERFRADIERPDSLSGGAISMDSLVASFLDALESSDTASFEPLAVDIGEYAWLYFPTTREAQPPYELPPSLAWFRVQEANRRGVFRAIREYGGRDLELISWTCGDDPVVEGENRIWSDCVVTFTADDSEPIHLNLFGAVLERGGRYKFLSYSNAF